jgi:hypothetical protein
MPTYGAGMASSPHKRGPPSHYAGRGPAARPPPPPHRGHSYDSYGGRPGRFSDGEYGYDHHDDQQAPPPPPRDHYHHRSHARSAGSTAGRRGDFMGDSDLESVVSATSAFSSQSAPHATRMGRRMG